MRLASVSNTCMKTRPMILRLRSGSITPASALRKLARALTKRMRMSRCRVRVTFSFSASSMTVERS